MKRICYIMAMQAEAEPLIRHFQLQERQDVFAPLPCRLHSGQAFGMEICVVTNGRQHGSDLIGCEAAAVATMAAIERLRPHVVVCSGTCGAWRRHGMHVGEVYLGSAVMFHDRRVPNDDAWHTQTLGDYPLHPATQRLAQRLGVKTAKVTTGSSFDMTAEEEACIERHGGRLKEMEAAAVAFVCQLFSTPLIITKAVTNLRDAPEENSDAFRRNLHAAAQNLNRLNIRLAEELAQEDFEKN